jgi:hypothetical protein
VQGSSTGDGTKPEASSSLPPLLAPHAERVAALADETGEAKAGAIQEVIAQVLAAGMRAHSCGIFVEDVHLLDDASANALALLAQETVAGDEQGASLKIDLQES